MINWQLWYPSPLEEEVASRVATEEETVSAIDAEEYKRGFNEGYKEGSARVRMEAARLNDLVTSLSGETLKVDQKLGQVMLDFCVHLAQQVVRHDLLAPLPTLTHSIHAALEHLTMQPLVLHLNPADVGLVRHHLAETLARWPHNIEEDLTLERGSCRIDTQEGEVDATLNTRWVRLLQSLGRNTMPS